jgi:hypothetical protein
MLTPKQYEAVGKLTLGFNEIEYAFEMYIAHLLGAPEWGVSVLLAGEGTFRHKAERFDHILHVIADERPAFHAQIEPIRQWVKRAKQLAEKRNEYVHALVVHDFQTNETRLRIKGTDTICNEAEINFLAVEMAVLVDQMHTHCGDLLVLVGEARESK